MICVIPARGGSTRIPRKNIKGFFGKPIIAYSIETAKKSGLFKNEPFDDIYVSTDDPEIGAIAQRYGAKRLNRSRELSVNEIGTQEVIRDAISRIFTKKELPEYTCCLYATTPLLLSEDIHRGLKLLKRNPYANYAFSAGTEPLHDAGGFYWGRTEAFLENKFLFGERSIMVPLPSERVCDINTIEDWEEAERKYLELQEEKPKRKSHE